MEKSFLTILVVLMIGVTAHAQDEPVREFDYDAGDTIYHMKQYVFCLYLSGPNRSQSEEEAAQIQKGHLAHLGALESQGLQISGPFGDDTEKRGVLLFDLETVDDAAALIDKDPMVIHGRLTYECHPLWLAKGTTLK